MGTSPRIGIVPIVILATLMFINAAAANQDDTAHQVRMYRAAVLQDFPPLYSLDNQGNPQGFAIDLLDQVAQSAQFDYEFLVVENWADAMQAVRDQRADFIPGIGISLARQTEFAFTTQMETLAISCFVRARERGITGWDDLRNLNSPVAVIEQSVADTELAGRGRFNVVTYPNIDAGLNNLLAGEVDAFAFPEPVLRRKLRQMGIESRLKVVGTPLRTLKRGYLLRKDDTELREGINQHLHTIVHSPQYTQMYRKWYGLPEPKWTPMRIFLLMGGILILSSLTLILWKNYSVARINRDLRRSEERLNLALRASDSGLWDWHVPTGDVYFNDHYYRIAGYEPDDFPHTFEQWIARVHPDDRQETLEQVERCRNAESVQLKTEFRFLRKDGTWMWVLGQGRVTQRDDRGEPVRFTGTHLDITQRKEAELQLAQINRTLNERIEEATRQNRRQEQLMFEQKKFADMGQMLSAIAHQWRQPLNNISLISQTLREMPIDDREADMSATELLDTQDELIRHMSTTIDDFRSFFTSNRTPAPFSPVQEILATASLVSAQMKASQIEVQIACQCMEHKIECTPENIQSKCGASGAQVWGSAGGFRQVVMNILSNARDAIQDAPASALVPCARIRIAMHIEPHQVHIRICNTGLPISDDILTRIFNPYFTTKSPQKGTGIGLYMSRNIIEKDMHGRISVENTDHGVCFCIWLPCYQGNTDREDPA